MSRQFYGAIINVLKCGTKSLSRTTIHGLDNIPSTGSVIFTPNHVSNLDPVLVGSSIYPKRSVKALAKDSLFTIPVVGKVITKMGHIPVLRNSPSAKDSLEKAIEGLKEGEAIAIYPEGTIPVNLDEIGPLKTGAVRLALLSGSPIVPIAQWGAQHSLPKHAKAKDILKALFTRPKHTIVVGEELKHPLLDGVARTGFTNQDVKDITQHLAQVLEEMVNPLRDKQVGSKRSSRELHK